MTPQKQPKGLAGEILKEEWLAFNVKQCESQGVPVTGDMITAFKMMSGWWLSKLSLHLSAIEKEVLGVVGKNEVHEHNGICKIDSFTCEGQQQENACINQERSRIRLAITRLFEGK